MLGVLKFEMGITSLFCRVGNGKQEFEVTYFTPRKLIYSHRLLAPKLDSMIELMERFSQFL